MCIPLGKLHIVIIDDHIYKAVFTTFCVRHLHSHAYGRNRESVIPVENIQIGLSNNVTSCSANVVAGFLAIWSYFKILRQHIAKMPYSSLGKSYYTNSGS